MLLSFWKKLTVILVIIILTSGCQGPPSPQELRIAVLPILDTLPLYVAEMQGLFVAQGLAVKLIPVASAAERDQLLQAGQIDGFITDLVALALYNQDVSQVIAVRYAMTPSPEYPQFRILTAPASGITTASDLQGIPIAISEGTIIEYVTYRLLEDAGLNSEAIATIAVPKIPDRMALLEAGEVQAATLPEPLASLAEYQGAVTILDDTQNPTYSCSVYAFRKEVVRAQPENITRFLEVINNATEQINTDKSGWNALLVEKNLIPAPILESYQLPTYPSAEIPTEAQFMDVARWLQNSGRIQQTPQYQDSVSGNYVAQ